jgi:arginase
VSTTLVQVPYHLGREGGLGKGVPVLATALADLADENVIVAHEREPEPANETAGCFDVVRALSTSVSSVVDDGRFPLVLAGNCHSSLGTCAGLGRPVGVVWLDAHADFNTPETTTSGFFDGMALALLTGACWEALRRTVPGHRPVAEEHVVLVARDLDPAEEQRLSSSSVLRAEMDALPDALDRLRERVEDVYLHVDLDVLDESVGRANWFAGEGGATVEQLQAAIDDVGARFTIRAAALTAYTPDTDPEGSIPPAARALADRIVAAEVAAP